MKLLLRCQDLAATRAFYRELPGFTVADTAEGTVTAQGFGGALIFTEGDLWGCAPGGSATVYFGIPDADALFARLAPTVAVAWPPETMSYGSREFGIRDCNGYHLAFREET